LVLHSKGGTVQAVPLFLCPRKKSFERSCVYEKPFVVLPQIKTKNAMTNAQFFNQSTAGSIMLIEVNKEIQNGMTPYDAICEVEHRMVKNAVEGMNTSINLLAIMEAMPYIENHFLN